MKRTLKKLCLLLFCLLSSLYLMADDLTPEQLRFRSSIVQFLKEEGFSPTIDDDNSVNFKKEGTHFWIDISGSNPFFVIIHRSGLGCNNANIDLVLKAVNEGNKESACAKAYYDDTFVSLAVETHFHSTEEFRYVFYKYITELEDIDKTVSDYYSEHLSTAGSSSFTINSVAIANINKSGEVITDYGSRLYDYNSRYLKPRLQVNVSTPGTYDIYVKFYAPSGLSTGPKSPSGYSYFSSVTMTSGNGTYYLDGWGGETSGQWKEGNYRFEFYYKDNKIWEESFTIY